MISLNGELTWRNKWPMFPWKVEWHIASIPHVLMNLRCMGLGQYVTIIITWLLCGVNVTIVLVDKKYGKICSIQLKHNIKPKLDILFLFWDILKAVSTTPLPLLFCLAENTWTGYDQFIPTLCQYRKALYINAVFFKHSMIEPPKIYWPERYLVGFYLWVSSGLQLRSHGIAGVQVLIYPIPCSMMWLRTKS